MNYIRVIDEATSEDQWRRMDRSLVCWLAVMFDRSRLDAAVHVVIDCIMSELETQLSDHSLAGM